FCIYYKCFTHLWKIFKINRVTCEQLTQPASLTVQSGQPLTITCQVSYSFYSYYAAWIRQPAGKGLEWIGIKSIYNTFYQESLKNKFSIVLDSSSKTATLNGQNMQPGDSAVYYCARWNDYDTL
uniref:Ig-like domain-containing protein n=1 Tax=Xiphophorus maculatus TaxID=8083 RepID=A0A3B5QDS7_XIPMA